MIIGSTLGYVLSALEDDPSPVMLVVLAVLATASDVISVGVGVEATAVPSVAVTAIVAVSILLIVSIVSVVLDVKKRQKLEDKHDEKQWKKEK